MVIQKYSSHYNPKQADRPQHWVTIAVLRWTVVSLCCTVRNSVLSYFFLFLSNPTLSVACSFAGGSWMLIYSERKVLLAGCWWLVCSERKVLLAGG
jgi:hypothetical protein